MFAKVGCLCALLAACALGDAAPGSAENQVPAMAGHLIFEAKVRELTQPSNHLAAGQREAAPVVVSLSGEMINPPIEVEIVPKGSVRRNTPEATSASDFSAFKASDPDWIASNFAQGEKEAMGDNFRDHMVLEKSHEIFDHYQRKTIIGRARYKEFLLLFVNYHDWPAHLHAEAYLQEGTQWKRTNILNSDDTFDVVTAALKTGQMKSHR